MKHLKPYKIFESNLSKHQIVDKLKWFSNYLDTYIKDLNKISGTYYLSVKYNGLTLMELFNCCSELNYESHDSTITAISNEFIKIGEYIEDEALDILDKDEFNKFTIDYNYLEYSDEYKKENQRTIYFKLHGNSQKTLFLNYILVGREVLKSINGTKWEAPDIKIINDDDYEFILDCIISDYEDVSEEYIHNFYDNIIKVNSNTGMILKFKRPNEKKEADNDFIWRLNSYFNGVLLKEAFAYSDNFIFLYLPFYSLS